MHDVSEQSVQDREPGHRAGTIGHFVDRLTAMGCPADLAAEVVNAAYLAGKGEQYSPEEKVYSEEFQRFWKVYPKTPNMSKKEAWVAWKKVRAEERPKIIAAAPRYAEWLRQQRMKPRQEDFPAVHACRFISQRRFDGFESQEEISGAGYYAKPGTDQHRAWDQYLRSTRGRGLQHDRTGGWWVQSEWPPQQQECVA